MVVVNFQQWFHSTCKCVCVYFQGVLFAMPECAKQPVELVRLWMHEADRVYRDKLVDNTDMESYDKIRKDIVKKSFEVNLLVFLP